MRPRLRRRVTGATTPIGSFSPTKCAFDLEVTLDGSRLGTRIVSAEGGRAAELIEFNLTTGDVTKLSDLGDFLLGGPRSAQGNLTFSTAGALYTYLVPGLEPTATAVDPACDGSAFCLFQVDQTDPTNLTYVNHVPEFETTYVGLATSCSGVTSSAWVEFDDASMSTWNGANATVSGTETLTKVNLTATGPATTDVGVITDTLLSSLDYNSAGTLYGVGFGGDSSTPSLFTVNPTTGSPTEVHGLTHNGDPYSIGVVGFAIAHPCAAPPAPPTPAPAAVVTAPRFTR